MTHEATQSLNLASDKGYTTQNKDILTKKVRWDRYLKSASYLMYSIFVALLSLSIIFSHANDLEPSALSPWTITIDLISVFIGLFTLLFSIWLISWVYKGTTKKLFINNYYIMHFVNSLVLMSIFIVLSLPMFAYDTSPLIDANKNVEIRQTRSLIFAIGLCIWGAIAILGLLINTYRMKNTFPTVWLKVKLSLISILIFPIISLISWISSNPKTNGAELFLWIELIIFILGFLYIAFIFSYIKSFKELLLSDKTEQEIQKIDIFRNVSFLMILTSSVAAISFGIFKIIPLELSNWVTIDILPVISIAIDAIILILYLTIIILSKKRKMNKNKLTTIDNSMLMEFLTWFLLLQTIICVAIPESLNLFGYVSFSVCFLVIFIINISTILLGVNFPNIKNTTSTILNIMSALAILAMVLYQSTFKPLAAPSIFEAKYILVLMLLPVIIASSISIGIKIITYSKITNNNDGLIEEDIQEVKKNSKKNNIEETKNTKVVKAGV